MHCKIFALQTWWPDLILLPRQVPGLGYFLILLLWRGDGKPPLTGCSSTSGEPVKETCPKKPGWRAIEEDF